MEKTIENKLKLFGTNIGGQVEFEGQAYTLGGVILHDITINHNGDYITINKGNVILSGDFSGIGNVGTSFVSIEACKLLLTRLSAVTDEDAIELSKFFGYEDDVYKVELKEVRGFNINLKIYYPNGWSDSWFTITPEVSDYLRSKGYAVPFMGLSVEQQIEYGWVKLKTT